MLTSLFRKQTSLSKKIVSFFIVFFLLLPQIYFPQITHGINIGSILISEVQYDSVGAENEGEWFELYNPTDNLISLAGWTIGEDATGVEYSFTGGVEIYPGEFLLVVNDTATFQSEHAMVLPDIDMEKTDSPSCVSNGECLRLNNDTGDSLTLKDSSGDIIDYVGWEGVGGFDLNGDQGHSVCRRNLEDTNTDAEWANNCSPTPGSGTFTTTFPGGIPVASLLWAKASSEMYSTGATINILHDWSGNDRDGTGVDTPLFNTSDHINFYPTIQLDGVDDGFTFPNYTFPIEDKNYTMYSVFTSDLASDTMTLGYVGREYGTNNSIQVGVNSDGSLYDDFDNGLTNKSVTSPGIITENIPSIVSFHYDSSIDEKSIYHNTSNITTLTGVADHNASNSPSSDRSVGFNGDAGDSFFSGNIAEILVYDTILDEINREKVDSYLSLKYGITTEVGKNYIDNSGNVLWDANLNADYHNNVIGIGTLELSGLFQTISHSSHSGGILTISSSEDFTSLNTNFLRFPLDDGQFVIIGSNASSLNDQDTELDQTLYSSRIEREWKVESSSDIFSMFLQFDGYNDEYVLLSDDDGDFSTGSINQGSLNSDGTAFFPLPAGNYFTLAKEIPNTPPTNITLDNNIASENSDIGTFIGKFSSIDIDLGDSHTYTFVTGTGDTDNHSFSLSGSSLFSNDLYDYELSPLHSIRIQTADNAGEVFQKAFTIEITDIDENIPLISIIGSSNVNQEVHTDYVELGVYAVDVEDGEITENIIFSGSVDTSVLGEYMITYNVADSSGKSAEEVVRYISIVDTTSPEITYTGVTDFGSLVNENFIFPEISCEDNYDVPCQVTSSGTVDTSTEGVYEVIFSAIDSSLNTSEALHIFVEILSNGIPTITLYGSGNIIHEVNSPYFDEGAHAYDYEDGELTQSVIFSGSVDTAILGNYKIYYNVIDSDGNSGEEAIRNISVVDTIPPFISYTGSTDHTIISHTGGYIFNTTVGESFTIPEILCIDNYDESCETSHTGSVNTSATGSYDIIFSATDSSGNKAGNLVITVEVVEDQAPFLEFTGEAFISLEVHSAYVDEGVSAFDYEDGDITEDIISSGSVDTSTIGYYEITYNVTDSKGNKSGELRRGVQVVDTTKPELSYTGSTSINYFIGENFTLPEINCRDNYDASCIVFFSGSIFPEAIGSYPMEYYSADSSGNISDSISITTHIISGEAPIISLIGEDSITISIGEEYSDPGAQALDAEDGNISSEITMTGDIDIHTAGDYTREYTIIDSHGNKASITRTLHIQAINIAAKQKSSGGSIKHMDVCNNGGDTSGDYYDGLCGDNNTDEKVKEEKIKNEDTKEEEVPTIDDNVTSGETELDASTEEIILKKEEQPEISVTQEKRYTLQNDFSHCKTTSSLKLSDLSEIIQTNFSDNSSISNPTLVYHYAAYGVINGTNEGLFQPKREVSRSEFLKILLLAHCYDYSPFDQTSFVYTNEELDQWQKRVIQKAENLKWINGDYNEQGERIFRANDAITKAEAIKILLNIGQIQSLKNSPLIYTDVNIDWHKRYILTAQNLGILDPFSDSAEIHPENGLSRESVLELLHSTILLY